MATTQQVYWKYGKHLTFESSLILKDSAILKDLLDIISRKQYLVEIEFHLGCKSF